MAESAAGISHEETLSDNALRTLSRSVWVRMASFRSRVDSNLENSDLGNRSYFAWNLADSPGIASLDSLRKTD